MAVWLYLSGLHAIDYSKKDRVGDGIEDSPSKARSWQEEVMTLLSNMAAAFGAKDDNYNAIRSADLGLAFADKLRTTRDNRDAMRAKLYYRRGIARARRDGDDAAEAADDVAKAVELDNGKDKAMVAALRRLKAAAKRQKVGFAEIKGIFAADHKPPAQPIADDNHCPPLQPPKNIAERRADRRKLSKRFTRLARALAAKFPAHHRLTRAAVLAFTAVAVWLGMPKRNTSTNLDGSDPLPRNSWRFRFVIVGLVLARIVDFAVGHYSNKRRPLLGGGAANRDG